MCTPIENRQFPSGDFIFDFSNEGFTEVKDITFEPVYYNNGIKGAVNRCFMRCEVYRRLKIAMDFLPEGYRLKIYDAWRPFEVQRSLYEDFLTRLKAEKNGISESEANELVKLFVSPPVKDEAKGPVHSTGGAVDVTIIDENGNEADMGTEFDFFGEEANTDFFEHTDSNEKARHNRRILYNAMIKAGFTNLPTEWWHYDYGNKFHSFYTGGKAIYGCIFDVV